MLEEHTGQELHAHRRKRTSHKQTLVHPGPWGEGALGSMAEERLILDLVTRICGEVGLLLYVPISISSNFPLL